MARRIRWRTHLTGYLFISPWLVGLFFFSLGPIIASFALAFARWDLFNPPNFVGMGNYVKLSHDPLFYKAISVTAYYTVLQVPLGIAFALGLALLVNHKLKGITIYRTIFFLPNIAAGVAMMLVWKWLFNPDFGLINQILDVLHITDLLDLAGLGRPQWLASRSGAVPALVIMSIWGIGGSMMIFLAGLQNVPDSFIEAAEIDGANAWQRFRHVTLPLLTPTIFFLLVIGTIASLQVFTQAFIMTQGGPANATLFYSLYLFNNAFGMFRMGYACALALFLFLAILLLTLVQLYLSKRWVHYQ
jgi:multiple sugar transport system permease protein